VRIREVDLGADRDRVLALLTASLPRHGGEPHWEWLYVRNPDGPARAWLAEDDAGEAVGVAAAFPRRVWIEGREHTCWNLGDFAIRPDHRSLGPAVRLQRAVVAAVSAGAVPFAWDHPRSNMMAIYKRIGVAETGRVVRWAKPLRIDDRFEALTRRIEPLGAGLAALGNLLLRTADLGRGGGGARAGRAEEIGPAFAALDERLAATWRVRVRRGPDYLRWRFFAHPGQRFELLTVGEGDALGGWAVLEVLERHVRLADLLCEPRAELEDGLLAGVLAAAREHRAATLSFPALDGSALAAVAARWGFRPRESSAFVVTAGPDARFRGLATDPREWYLTHGDRDV